MRGCRRGAVRERQGVPELLQSFCRQDSSICCPSSTEAGTIQLENQPLLTAQRGQQGQRVQHLPPQRHRPAHNVRRGGQLLRCRCAGAPQRRDALVGHLCRHVTRAQVCGKADSNVRVHEIHRKEERNADNESAFLCALCLSCAQGDSPVPNRLTDPPRPPA